MTRTQARLAAGFLSAEARKALLVSFGIVNRMTISEEGLAELVTLEMGRRTTNLLDGADVFVLTPRGKAVATELAREYQSGNAAQKTRAHWLPCSNPISKLRAD